MKNLSVKYSYLFNIDRKLVYKLFYEIKQFYNCCEELCYVDLLYHKYKVNMDKSLINKLIKRLYLCDINTLICSQ